MNNYKLSFISDGDLYNQVKETVSKYSFGSDINQFNKNLIDPIKLNFDLLIYNLNPEQMINQEVQRQADKTNNNAIGYFHQNIFKYLKNINGDNSGWEVPSQGFDVINESKCIFVEMKNKHNTMNSSSATSTYRKMQDKINEDSNNKCFLVEVIAKKSQDINWQVTINGEQKESESIRRVSIDKFYEIVTGHSEAFCDLIKILPKVIEDVLKDKDMQENKNEVYSKLKAGSSNIFQSLYLLAFPTYQGFYKKNE